MNISNQTKLLLLIAVILIFILFMNNYYNQEPMQNEGSLVLDSNNYVDDEFKYLNNEIPRNDLVINEDPQDFNQLKYDCVSGNCEEENYRKKVRGKNKATNGQYKKSSYSEGKRGNGSSEFDEFFDKNNEMVKDVYATNDTYTGNDETGGNLAAYKPGKRVKMSDEDMFNANNWLPQEEKKDWFDVMPEPVSVKNNI